MPDLLPDACAALLPVLAHIHLHFPRRLAVFPCGVLLESDNRVHAQADGIPYLHEVELTLEIWARSPGETHALSLRCDERLTALGLRRTGTTELYDPDAQAHRRVLRYRALCGPDGILTQ